MIDCVVVCFFLVACTRKNCENDGSSSEMQVFSCLFILVYSAVLHHIAVTKIMENPFWASLLILGGFFSRHFGEGQYVLFRGRSVQTTANCNCSLRTHMQAICSISLDCFTPFQGVFNKLTVGETVQIY